MMTRITLYLLCLTIILSPLYVVRWDYFGQLPTTLLELLVWLTIVAWLVTKATRREFSLKIDRSLLWPTIMILTAAIVSTWIAPDRWAALGILRAYFIEPLIIYLIALDLFSRFNNFQFSIFNFQFTSVRLIWYSLITAGIWLSLLGISQFLLHWPIFTNHQLDRAHGVFNNGNALALFLGPILAVLISQKSFSRNWFRHWKLSVTVIVLLIAFLMTKSTGGVLGLLGTLVTFQIIKQTKSSRFLRLLLVVCCLLFVVLLTQISHFTPTTVNPWIRTGGTAQVRLCLWEGTYNLLRDRPLLGAGLTGFQSLYSNKYHTCDAEPLVYPHNILLNFWVEIGILGILGILAMLWVILGRPENQYTPAFIYLFLHGMVDVPYFKNDLALIFWVLIALWSLEHITPHHPPDPASAHQQ